MTSGSRGTRKFRVMPLTPVHFGVKEELSPEEYILEGGQLVRLDLPGLIRLLNPAGKKKLEAELDTGNLREVQDFIQRFWSSLPSQLKRSMERYRIEVSDTSREELRQLIERPERQGNVMVLPRNPLSGEVMIPGSAIKGAIRTALVSHFANDGDNWRTIGPLLQAPERNPGRVLEEQALKFSSRDTSKDPLRLLRVSDATWPAGAVRIDRASPRKLGRSEEQTGGIQMHVERLKARADQDQIPEVEIEIRLSESPRLWDSVGRNLGWNELISWCTSFFVGRLNVEYERFSFLNANTGRWLPSQNEVDGGLLLRAGRFCHFDSLSIDGHRQNMNMRTREPIELGATRTVCEIEAGVVVPFGWILLEPV